jgi:formate--tetrahydrofolate ligase
LTDPDVEALKKGLPNLEKHLENIVKFNITPVIAINKFTTDTAEEIEIIKNFAVSRNVRVAVADIWAKGGAGALELGQLVIDAVESKESNFTPLYDWKSSVVDKISTIATEVYGAKSVEYASKAKAHLRKITRLGLDHLPVCVAKTQKSLSDNPKLLGRPRDFVITVREIEIAAGAGFLVPITGDMMRMPGLPSKPASENIDIDENGEITGLF